MKVNRSANSGTVVTVTVLEDGMTAKYAQKCAQSEIRATAKECRTQAVKGLDELQAAMREIERDA